MLFFAPLRVTLLLLAQKKVTKEKSTPYRFSLCCSALWAAIWNSLALKQPLADNPPKLSSAGAVAGEFKVKSVSILRLVVYS